MSALTQISTFANNAAAVEKTLRLGQSVTLIGGSLQPTIQEAAPYVLARGQLNLSRRFLRLFKWIDNFNAAAAAISSNKASIPRMLETAKFTFLAIYFLMEFVSITDIMGLTKFPAGGWIVVESNRMWFYGLIFGILQAIWEGLFEAEEDNQQKPVSEKGKKEKKEAEKAVSVASPKKGLPFKQLFIDSCDLIVPGAVIQVIPFSPLAVGIAMLVSTVLQLIDMWSKVQAQAATAAASEK